MAPQHRQPAPGWSPYQRRTLRVLGAFFFVGGFWYAWSCLLEDPSHGEWWPYQCAPAMIAVVLAAALWQEATWAVVAVFGLLALAILLLLRETFTNEPAAILMLWLPILFLVALFRDVGRTTWERLKGTNPPK